MTTHDAWTQMTPHSSRWVIVESAGDPIMMGDRGERGKPSLSSLGVAAFHSCSFCVLQRQHTTHTQKYMGGRRLSSRGTERVGHSFVERLQMASTPLTSRQVCGHLTTRPRPNYLLMSYHARHSRVVCHVDTHATMHTCICATFVGCLRSLHFRCARVAPAHTSLTHVLSTTRD